MEMFERYFHWCLSQPFGNPYHLWFVTVINWIYYGAATLFCVLSLAALGVLILVVFFSIVGIIVDKCSK